MAVGPRTGDTRGARRALATALVAVVVLAAGCGGGDDDGGSDGAPTTGGSITTESTSEGPDQGSGAEPEATTTTSTEPGGTPDGAVKVPLDEELAARLPSLFVGDGIVSEDEAFDERLCDGRRAPTVPDSQARADYHVSASESVTIAAYRFPSGVGPYYLSVYSEAVRACAVAAGDSADLDLGDEAVGFAYELETTRGKAFIALALRDDVLWVLFQENTDGRPSVDPTTLDLFVQAVLV